MPAKALWLLHIPEIVSQLETFDVPVLDRAIIERLFGLRRRQAIELLHRFGGYQAGRTFLVDRHRLIDRLRRLADGEEFQRESRRQERLDEAVDRLRRYQTAAHVKIPVAPDVFSRKLADLPLGVALEAGHLHIAFSGTEDLLRKLFELSQAASNGGARRSPLHRGLLDMGRGSVMAEQGGIDQRVELGQRLGAQFLGVELQGGGDARQFGEFHAAAAGFPLRDAFRGDVEDLGDLRLEKRKFYAAPAQQDVQRHLGSSSDGRILVHDVLHGLYFIDIDETNMRQEKGPYFSGRIRTWFNSQIASRLAFNFW